MCGKADGQIPEIVLGGVLAPFHGGHQRLPPCLLFIPLNPFIFHYTFFSVWIYIQLVITIIFNIQISDFITDILSGVVLVLFLVLVFIFIRISSRDVLAITADILGRE